LPTALRKAAASARQRPRASAAAATGGIADVAVDETHFARF
jgi:hypothetical protein